MQEAERREHEVRKFKEEQKQIMIEKERQARENERKKREQETKMNNERVRSAAQAHDERGGNATKIKHERDEDQVRKVLREEM